MTARGSRRALLCSGKVSGLWDSGRASLVGPALKISVRVLCSEKRTHTLVVPNAARQHGTAMQVWSFRQSKACSTCSAVAFRSISEFVI